MKVPPRAFSLSFLALLMGIGAMDAARHAVALTRDPYRLRHRVGVDSAGGFLGGWKSNLDIRFFEAGDLARTAHILPFAREHEVRIVTDPWGFLNPGYRPGGTYDAVIIGDCMSRGSPGEMLHEYLAGASGRAFYNYNHLPAKAFLKDQRFRASPPGVIILQRVERGFNGWWVRDELSNFDPGPPRPRKGPPWRRTLGRIRDKIPHFRERWRNTLDVFRHSLLKEQLQWVMSTVRYRATGRLPESVPALAPETGMLFLQDEVSSHGQTAAERDLPEVLDSLEAFGRLCRARGITLAVLLVPDKYTIYGDGVPGRGTDMGPAFRAALQTGLRERGLLALDVVPALAAEAGRRDSLLYYTDDTRWTPFARRLAAREIARQLEVLAPSGWNSPTAGRGQGNDCPPGFPACLAAP